MSEQPLHLGKSSLAYAKLVATPTTNAWSQVYNAGNLFACLELTVVEPQADRTLHGIGKDLFSALEAEFFTLEEKNLATISQAIVTSLSELPKDVKAHLSLAFFKDDILYLFIAGAGKIIMKRQDQIAVLLEKHDDEKTIATASGYLNNKDLVILQTHQFAQNISDETLSAVIELALPSDIAEALSPQIHEKDDGGQAAIIIVYHGPTQREPELSAIAPSEMDTDEDQDKQTEIAEEEKLSEYEERPRVMPKLPFSFPKLTLPKTLPEMHLNQRKKLFLGVFILLIALLVGGIFITKSQEEGKARHAQFLTIYTPAEKSYEEGKALKGLNDSLSQQDFLTAQQSIKDNLSKFPKGSTEEKQLSDLLSKIDVELGGKTSETPSNLIEAKEVKAEDNSYLTIVKENSGLAFGQNADSVFILTDSAVTTVSKSGGSKKEIINNDSDWKKGKGVVPYQGNVYVLDAENGVLKFTAGSDGFGKTNYFKSSVDTSKAVAMAIDGSVWILSSEGTIQKYTRGTADTFKINGLAKPLSTPTALFTNIDTESLYILDRGNSRIVKLSKEGVFQKEYAATILSQTRAFHVVEKDKKIQILANDKFFEISL